MNIQSLKQRLSPKNIGQSIQRILLRFPLTVSFLVALTGMLSYMIITGTEPEEGSLYVFTLLSVGILIDFVMSLWGEEHTNRRYRWMAESILLVLFGTYYALLFFTDLIPNRGLPAFYLGNMAWLAALVVLIPFCSFWREKDDLKSWHFILSLCLALLISGMITWVMTGGLEGLVYGTAALFDLNVSEKVPLVIMVVCAVLLFGLLFLALVPYAERKHNNAAEMPSFLMKSVSWLLIPLLGCYILVLYIYGITILVHWELPKGMISWLVSAVMAGYLMCYLLLYPQVTNRQSWQSKLLTFWLPIAILPLLILMTVGVVRRFMDYGITAPRLYLLTLLLWFYAVCIIMLVAKRKRFHWIFLSLAALFLLSSGQPMNYYRLCKPVLVAKIEKTIADKQLAVPFNLYSLENNHLLTVEEANELYTNISYVRDNYGSPAVEQWVGTDVAPIDSTRTEIWTCRVARRYDAKSFYPCPQGFASFQHKYEYRDIILPEDSLYDGAVHFAVRVNENFAVFPLDTAAINSTPSDQPYCVYSVDGQTAYVLDGIQIKGYSDHTIEVSGYEGYLFSKDK